MTAFSDELYDKLSVIDAPSSDLHVYCNAIGEMFADIERLVRSEPVELVEIPHPALHFEDSEDRIGAWRAWRSACTQDATETDEDLPSLKVVTESWGGPGGSGIFTILRAIGGHTYDVNIRVKAPLGMPGEAFFDYYTADEVPFGPTWISADNLSFTGTGEWEDEHFEITLPEGAHSMDAGVYRSNGVETFYVGKFSIKDQADSDLPAWGRALDPEATVNEAVLLWLAQLAGVRVPIGSKVGDIRTVIELAEGRRRGTIEYMVEVAQRLLTGDKFVWVSERDGSAYRLSIVTRTDETPDEDAVRAALLAVKPAGIVLTYTVSDGVTWDEPVHAWNSAGAVTWDESQDTVP